MPPNLTRPKPRKEDWGELSGFQLVYQKGNMFWRRWWLASGHVFVFVTYNCPIEHEENELHQVNEMMTTIRLRKKTETQPSKTPYSSSALRVQKP